jgi:sigma-B regulation protein RsbU (phosphoserine phosphatase)
MVIFSLTLFIPLIVNFWQYYQNFNTLVVKEIQLQKLNNQLIYVQEVLFNSAQIYVATGEKDYEARYREYETKLNSLILESVQIAPEIYNNSELVKLEEVNKYLLEIESKSLELSLLGKSQEAQNLLKSEDYLKARKNYVLTLENIQTKIEQKISDNINQNRRRLLLSALGSSSILAILIPLWIYALKIFNNYLEEQKKVNKIQKENLRLATELEISNKLQKMLLPKEEELEAIKNLDISGFMQPATEIGGDYYDVLQDENRVKIGIGDVTGHGLESGIVMLMIQTAVRTLLAHQETDATKFLNTLNKTIYDNVQRMNSEKNLTLALLDYQGGIVRLSGQHEEVIVVRNQGEIELIDTIDLGFPLGLEDNITDFIGETEIKLNPGDGIILYTDGITEAENPEGETYGLDRLCQVISRNWDLSAKEIKNAIIKDLETYINQHTILDDITLLVVKQK